MVLTVEPGLYFNNYQIDKGLSNPNQAQYLVKERLENMRDFGGARIEDMVRSSAAIRVLPSALLLPCPRTFATLANEQDCRVHTVPLQVVVTATGIEQLTTVPRDVERVEAICQGGFYDPMTGNVNAA